MVFAVDNKKAPQSRGMSAMLRRLALRRAGQVFAAGAMLFAASQASFGASQTFSGTPVDTNLGNGANYVGGVAPGSNTATGGTVSPDVITFNTPVNPTTLIGDPTNPLNADAGTSSRTIAGILFAAGAGAYQIGSPGAITVLQLSTNQANSNVTMAAGDTSSEILAAVAFHQPSSTNGTYAFVNNSTTTAATMTISSTLVNGGTTRPVSITLSGTNTGTNTISGAITDTASQLIALINKTGAGTWILSNANTFSGAAATNAAYGIRVNGGLLVLQNNQALGTSGTANSVQVSINADTGATGGILQLANGITLDNGVSLNLANGGTIQSNGTNATNARINLSTTAGTSATVSTVNAGDVFTVGNGANDLTGGSATSTLHFAGPGTIILGQSSNLLGSVSVDSGIVQLGNAAALGTSMLAFSAGSTGNLQLNGNTVTVTGLSTNAATPGTPVVGDGGAAATGLNILTDNTAAATNVTYAGLLRDNTGGTDIGMLGLTKSGTGSQTLTGANTYSGGTLVSGGTLAVSNTSGSGTGTGAVTLSGIAVLGGTGTVSGAVTTASGTAIAPGAVGVGNIGTLTLGGLTLSTGSNLNFDLGTSSDQILVTSAGGLIINGGKLNINGGTSTFTANGVYNLIGFNGGIGGTGISALSVNATNQALSTNTYTFGQSNPTNGFVTLTVATGGTPPDYYNKDADDVWNDPTAWTSGVPNATGVFAAFGGGGTAITANRTVTVNGAYSVGTLAFNNPSFSYTLAAGTGANLTLDNGTNPAFITDTAGSHTIATPLTMTAQGATATVSNAGDTLTISGPIGGPGTPGSGVGAVLTKAGPGTLVLTGNNAYNGGTILQLGKIQINSPTSLGDPSGTLTFNGGSLQLLADVSTTRNYVIGGASDAPIDTNGHNLVLSGAITPASGALGGLNVTNTTGTIALTGVNTYVGPTTINGGTVTVAANTGFGATTSGANINLTNVTLVTTGNTILNGGASGTNDRPVTLGGTTNTFQPATGTNLTISGAISGSANILMNGLGTVTILEPVGGQNNGFTGTTLISSGTIALGDGNATGSGLGAGAVTLNGGTLNLFQANPTGTAATFANPLVISTGSNSTLITAPRGDVNSTITGSGTLNIQTSYTRSQFDGNATAFSGTVNLTGTNVTGGLANGGDFRLNNNLGFPLATVNQSAGTFIYDVLNFGTGGQTTPFGALNGVVGASLGSGPIGGRVQTYSIGGLNTSSEYDGTITNSGGGAIIGTTAITKVGTGVLTLTGANSYSAVTTIAAGTLNINGINALGGANYGTGTSNGNGTPDGGITFTGGTLQFSTTLATAANGGGDISTNDAATPAAAAVTFGTGGGTIDLNGNTVTFANTVGNGGAGGLTLKDTLGTGAGVLTLTQADVYSGGTTLNNATLVAAANTALGTGPVTQNPATGQTSTLNFTSAAPVIGALASSGAGTSKIELGNVNATTPNATSLTIANAASATYGGTITDGTTDATAPNPVSVGSVVEAGTAGIETLSGTNTYTGGTTVNSGTISGGVNSYGSGPITVNTGGTVDYSQATPGAASNNITGTGSVTKGGNTGGPLGTGGTITYTGVDSATGGTTVNAGTFLLNHTGGGAITGPVAAATGGTLGLGANNEIANTSLVTLAGGTLAANGHSEGTSGSAPGMGALQVGTPTGAATASILDFGDTTVPALNTLAFSDSASLTWNGTVTLTNYTDGLDKLYIGATNDLTTTQLSDIQFAGLHAQQDTTGLVTFTAAPEPSGWASMIIGMGVLGGIIARRRKTAKAV